MIPKEECELAGFFEQIENEPFNTMIEFNSGEVISEKFAAVNLKGHILCTLPDEFFPAPDFSGVEKADEWLTDWAIANGLIKKEKISKFRYSYSGFAAYTVPDLKLNENRMKAYMLMSTWFFTFDDVLDSKDYHYNSLEIHKNVIEAASVFIDILKGKYTNLEQLPLINFPLFLPLSQTLLEFNYYANLTIPSFQKKNGYLIEELKKYLEGVIWELEDKVVYRDRYISEQTYSFRRRYTIGVSPTIELIALMKEITITEEMRSDLKFKRIKEATSLIIAYTNDLFSLRKEIKDSEPENYIFFLLNQGYSLQTAVKRVNSILNNEIETVMFLRNDLKKKYKEKCGNSENARKLLDFLLITLHFIDGHLRWYENCPRYGSVKFETKKIRKLNNNRMLE